MDNSFFDFTAQYFDVSRRLINKRTRIESLSRDKHDSINFSFEIEKQYGIEFEEEELEKLRSVGDYLKLIEGKIRYRNAA